LWSRSSEGEARLEVGGKAMVERRGRRGVWRRLGVRYVRR
jgi:hypothetical protein